MPVDAQLVATCWTTAGEVVPGEVDAESSEDFRYRVEVAAAAGFTGIGLNYADLLAARVRYGDSEIRAILDDHGIEHFEIEVLTGWYATGQRRRSSDDRRHVLLDAARSLGARLIKVIGEIGGAAVDLDRVAGELHVLAGQAGEAGARVGIESSPLFDLATPADVLAVVERADHPAGGVLLDNWQIARAGVDVTTLRSFPAHRIAGAELSDAPLDPGPDLVVDCFDHRGLPGSGELDVAGFVAAVRATGYDGPWGVEILHTDYRRLPIAEAVPTAHAAAARVLDHEHPTWRDGE